MTPMSRTRVCGLRLQSVCCMRGITARALVDVTASKKQTTKITC